MAFPHAMLRCGYPYERVLGMRRVTTFPVDIAVGEDRIYVIGRTELGVGGNIRMVSLKYDYELGDDLTHGDLGTMADTATSGRLASCGPTTATCMSSTRATTTSRPTRRMVRSSTSGASTALGRVSLIGHRALPLTPTATSGSLTR